MNSDVRWRGCGFVQSNLEWDALMCGLATRSLTDSMPLSAASCAMCKLRRVHWVRGGSEFCYKAKEVSEDSTEVSQFISRLSKERIS